MECRGLVDPLVNWVKEGSDGDWSPSHPTDAQRESILFLCGAFLFILIFWQGKIAYWYTTKRMRNKKTAVIKKVRVWKSVPIPILWPFKILTVLYHELSHAVVGMLTIWWREVMYGRPAQRGRIEFIMVDKYEGGLTQFGGDTKPNYALTLPAGYVGSCLIGCWFLFTGFNAKWSKYGALSLLCLTVIATIVCAFVKVKYAIIHHWHRICAWGFRWIFCNKEKAREKMDNHFASTRTRNEKANYYHDDSEEDGGPTEHDLHVSQDIIIGCSLLVGILLWAAWNWDDSIYLRFAMLGMGLLSALYAVWDIALDGIKYAEVAESDATLMAEVYNQSIQEYNGLHPHHPKRERGARFYAFIWLSAKVVVIIAVLIGAYFSFRETVAQQAIQSRGFLPAQFHYGLADLREDTKGASDAVSDTVSGWIDDN
ncbi:hypothetical protein CNC02125 [Cryptococcus deneoformans JEC21]|uniref:Peptidase M50B-like-domain-containing protein n=1 Tax=Cryptococcus deneoformans (strain JEC21 / ATCC MYA-565) TaxID=214684 RepID=A0A0S2LIA6_CRYD1|nr:hypothetical protein CNC02125 [Cryptococcus neoformans var. neoformans JEC21]ALO60453.1 hypothetical protein CNC02125 [Cryptococcus neoformans var. neoformans JEC21]